MWESEKERLNLNETLNLEKSQSLEKSKNWKKVENSVKDKNRRLDWASGEIEEKEEEVEQFVVVENNFESNNNNNLELDQIRKETQKNYQENCNYYQNLVLKMASLNFTSPELQLLEKTREIVAKAKAEILEKDQLIAQLKGGQPSSSSSSPSDVQKQLENEKAQVKKLKATMKEERERVTSNLCAFKENLEIFVKANADKDQKLKALEQASDLGAQVP